MIDATMPPRAARHSDCLLAQRIGTPLGAMLALADGHGLRLLGFVGCRGLKRQVLLLRRRLKCAVAPGENKTLAETRRQLARYFAGESLEFDLPLAPVGSPFQMRVWRELQKIPPGRTRSYAQLAKAAGAPGAARAVARANGSNRLALVIPCHRVISAGGEPGGYSGGAWRKKHLLKHEDSIARSTRRA